MTADALRALMPNNTVPQGFYPYCCFVAREAAMKGLPCVSINLTEWRIAPKTLKKEDLDSQFPGVQVIILNGSACPPEPLEYEPPDELVLIWV